MSLSGVCLFGERAKTGFEVVTISQKVAIKERMDVGKHISTSTAVKRYEMLSHSDEADAATLAILNADTDAHYGTFTSNYGTLHSARLYKGGLCTPLAELRRLAADLRHLHNVLASGKFTDATPLPSGLTRSLVMPAFDLWLFPADNRSGFSAAFGTRSLYAFLSNEVVALSMERVLLVCDRCGRFHRAVRKDKRFCGGSCRTAYFRDAVGATAAPPLGALNR